jgi:hypothetical protein
MLFFRIHGRRKRNKLYSISVIKIYSSSFFGWQVFWTQMRLFTAFSIASFHKKGAEEIMFHQIIG